jgi:glutaredoxin
MIETETDTKSEEIKALEAQLVDLQEEAKKTGEHPTEVYTRIVGYYRSVANWNKGKRDEYNHRKTFVPSEDQLVGEDNRHKQAHAEKKASVKPVRYLFFWRNQCPQCPSVKSLLPEMPFQGQMVDTDTEEGTQMAIDWEVYATPTLILVDDKGGEVDRLFTSVAVKEFLG